MRRFCLLLLALAVLIPCRAMAQRSASTGYTINIGVDGRPQFTQDAYLPVRMFMELGLKNAKDLFVDGTTMYIADSGNSRVLRVDLESMEVTEIGKGLLVNPTGVAADGEGRVYVADYSARVVYRFSAEGEAEQVFEKPEAASFGRRNNFIPIKVAPGDGGGVYIVNEGSTAGIVQMSPTGDFLGYFAANTVQMSLADILMDIFLTDEQMRYTMGKSPASFSNIYRGSNRLIYTLNRGADVLPRKHAVNGSNLLKDVRALTMDDAVDLAVTEDGRMVCLCSSGRVYEYTQDGYIICAFAGSSDRTDRIGLFEAPSGIGVDGDNNIYVLDERRGYIQVFEPTQAQRGIYSATQRYNEGLYDESISDLTSVLKYNDTSYLAHLFIGRNYLQKGDYETAMREFHTAQDREYYSEAYWEIRNMWLQEHTGAILLILMIAFALLLIVQGVRKVKPAFLKGNGRLKARLLRVPLLRDLHALIPAMRHPIDNFYEIQTGARGSVLSATILYILAFVLLILFQVGRGFIFSVPVARYSLSSTLVYFTGALGLFLAGNYFVCAINDGRGTFRMIYVGTAYALAPVYWLMPAVVLLSNFCTIDERFFIDLTLFIMLSWTLVTLYLMIMQIHEYSFRQATANLLLTLFFMVVAILVGSLIYLLCDQFILFVREIFTEVDLRVKMG